MCIRDRIKDNQIIITIAPGKTLSWLEEQFGKQVKIVRTMPNTPAMVGEGMTAACPNPYLNEEEIAYVKTLLQSFSRVEIVPERLMDVVVSVSGSSPAYVFVLIEAMADAAAVSYTHLYACVKKIGPDIILVEIHERNGKPR